MAEWLDERGVAFDLHRSWDGPPPSDPGEYAFIACLGAAQSVNDREPPWIAQEIGLLGDAVNAGVPVLGLCWGGQALSVALGGRADLSPRPETGWLPVVCDDRGIPAGPWLHYHYESFTVPDGAVELARSDAGPSAYRLGRHLGLQFHPEATPTMGEIWGHSDPRQPAERVLALAREGARFGPAARAQAFALFDAWFAGV